MVDSTSDYGHTTL